MNSKLSLLLLFFLASLTMCDRRQQRQLYYLVEEDFQTKPDHLLDLEANLEQIPLIVINCKKQQNKCLKFKLTEPLPLLVLWNGPGTGYKSLGDPHVVTFNNYIAKVRAHPIYPLRNFIDKLTFPQFMIMAVVAMQIFYMIFSALFKDRSGLSSPDKKQKSQ